MATGRLRVHSVIPGSVQLGPMVMNFARKGEGIVTAFSDAVMPLLRSWIDEDSDLEVLPFGAVVSRYLDLSGEEPYRLPQKGHQLAALAYACDELPDDSPFRTSARFPGFHQAVAETLGELHAWGLDADELSKLAADSSSRLRDKLVSLASLDRDASKVLESLGCMIHTNQLRLAMEAIPDFDDASRRLLVVAGADLHPLRCRWLRGLISQGVEITVVVERHATGGEVFRGVGQICQELGVQPEPVGDANRLLRDLFAHEPTSQGPNVEVVIASAADPLAEAEWALRECADSPSRSGIFVRDLVSYAPLLEAAAKRLSVPLALNRRAPLLTNAFARLTLAVLGFCASDDVRKLDAVLNSSYLGLSQTVRRGVESGLKDSHRMKGQQWDYLAVWADAHTGELPWLTGVLNWRKEAMAASVSLEEWLGRIRSLVDLLPWHSAMAEPVTGYATERDNRAQTVLQSTLAQQASIERATHQRSYPFRRFVERCREVWTNADVSVPGAEIGVRVYSDASAIGDVDRLCVLGMLEGVFPRRRTEDPILTDDERQEISAKRPDWPALPVSQDRADAERDEFYRMCAAARSRIVFSYPLTADDRDNIPAFYLSMVEAATGNVQRIDHPRPELAPLADLCLLPADRELRQALEADREWPNLPQLVTEAAKMALRPGASDRFEFNELRDALRCPFKYAARYRMKLHAHRSAERWWALDRLPQRVGLAGLPDRSTAVEALTKALEAELDLIYPEIDHWEMQLLQAGGLRLIQEWVDREFTARALWPKEEGSTLLNTGLGRHGIRNEMPGGVPVQGNVPALSRVGNVRVAHLYGSTPTEGKIEEDEQLYYGLHFLALHEPGSESALEIEGRRKRTLVVLARSAVANFVGSRENQLEIVNLGNGDDPSVAKKVFYMEVRKLLGQVMDRIQKPSIDPHRSAHCERCNYGELCRRSSQFSEEDSPFGEDVTEENG